MKTIEQPIVVEETYKADLGRVWSAITDIAEMPKWYFDNIPDFRPEVGFRTEFLVECGGRQFTHEWKITDVVPGERIVYDWRYAEYPGAAEVTFALAPEGGGTRLTVTNRVMDDFPDEIPEFTRESGVAGWTYFVKESLKKHLDGA